MYEHVFDEAFYREANRLGPEGTLEHFIAEGDRAGFDPCPYFSTRYYQTRYPNWRARGARTTVEDFLLRMEAGEARQPHPLIDPAYYRDRYPDLAVLGAKVPLHFFMYGDHEVRSPSAAFDADFYQRCYLALEQPYPFRHFVTQGRKAGNLTIPYPRLPDESRDEAFRLAGGIGRPLLFCSHDAQAAGVPILTLDFARAVAAKGWQPVFLLKWGGPLISRFRELGPTTLVGEGWDLAELSAQLPLRMPAVINTAAAADMAAPLAVDGRRCLLLIHEMAGYIGRRNFLPDLLSARDAGATLIASKARVATALEPALGPMTVIRPGIILPATPLAAFRRLRRQMVDGGRPVFIGAGHADHRKGFDLFLEAAELIVAATPNARFVWLGALDHWARALADEALACGLDLTLPGFVPDSLAWYRAADVYLLTSREDAGPSTVSHAAAVGTPFVGYAADLGVIGVIDACGRFIAPGDVGAFVEAAIDTAASITPTTRRELRRLLRREAAFEPYVDALLAQLTTRPADD